MNFSDSKQKKVIPYNSDVATSFTWLREHRNARDSIIELYGRELVSYIEDMINTSGRIHTALFQQILALHTAVHVCKQWEKDLKETPEFKEKKAYLIQAFSKFEDKNISVLELLTSDFQLFREASYFYNKIKD